MGIVILLVIIFIVSILLDFYIIRNVKALGSNKLVYTYIGISFVITIVTIIAILFPTINHGNGMLLFIWSTFLSIISLLSRIGFSVLSLIGDLFGLIKNNKVRKCFKVLGLFLSGIIITSMIYGAFVTARIPKVYEYNLKIEKLPNSFNGLRIVQISDLHLGNLCNNSSLVANVVFTINSLNPDLVVFTGDLVNSISTEAFFYKEQLSKIKAKYGVYSVLGNHDYGDYYKWECDSLKSANLQQLKDFQSKCGWDLLNNEHRIISNQCDSIIVVGVENWGEFPFPQYGKLNEAYTNLNDSKFKILLTHNPVHWSAEVRGLTDIDLTLSGHTHAMQIELNLLGRKWSPSKYRYIEYAGMYNENSQYLCVNRGIGFVGIPMRIGVNPEISLITIECK